MAARLLKLRFALLLSVFRARPVVVARRVVLYVVAAALAVAAAGFPLWLARRPEDLVAYDVVMLSAVTVGSLLVPFFAHRRLLEPRQFGHVPERPATIAGALLVTTPVSWFTIWLLVWLIALVVLRPEWHGHLWAFLIGAVLILALTSVSLRVASALSKLLIPVQASGTVRAIGVLLLLAALPVGVFFVAQELREPSGGDVAAVLGWTPFGAPFAGMLRFESGDPQHGLLRFGIALAGILALLAVWFPISSASLQRIDRPIQQGVARTGLGWFERFPARPVWVIGARALSYWARDPRYRIGLLAIPFAPAVMLVALWIAGVGHEALTLLPLPVILLMLGWSLHNDVATDSTAIWLHIASGTRGRHDRLGRLMPVLFVGVPLALVGSSVTVTVLGDWRALPAVLGMNLAVLLVACGVSSVFSARMPYPTTRPGDSPFAQPMVVGSGSGVAQTLSMLCACLLAVPPVVLASGAVTTPTIAGNLIALGFGLIYGLLILLCGVLLGGRFFERGGPELVAITQTFD